MLTYPCCAKSGFRPEVWLHTSCHVESCIPKEVLNLQQPVIRLHEIIVGEGGCGTQKHACQGSYQSALIHFHVLSIDLASQWLYSPVIGPAEVMLVYSQGGHQKSFYLLDKEGSPLWNKQAFFIRTIDEPH